MYLSSRTAQKGFTLIELLVYMTILVLMLVAIIGSVTGFARFYKRTSASQALARSGSYAMERMTREIRNAQTIDQTGSSLGAHPGRLTVVTPVSTGVTRSSEFSVVGNELQLSQDGIVTGTLTTPGTVVENLTFHRIATTTSEAVRIILTLSATFGTTTISASFYDTAVLRGSYPL
jgi:prepilin-type N-terminal cleavage/methylation domain-containing protein